MSDPTDTLRARVEQAQALAAAATPGPWRSEGDTMTGGMDFRYVMIPLPVGTSVASGIIARCPRFGTHAHEAAANADLMAAAPDMAALVTDLWAEVERLTAERDSLRFQAGEASHVLAAALYGDERAGEQPHLSSLARMMVDALTLEAANAEQARMQLDNGDDVDAATRRYLGEALGIADSDDTPPSLSDFYDAVVEARAERDAAAAKERAAVVAWLAESSGRIESMRNESGPPTYSEVCQYFADAIERGDHLEVSDD